MKVFLSQPMRGKTHEEILSSIREVQEFLTKYLDSTNIEIIESYSPRNKDKEPLVALGDSIKDLAKADLAVFLNDWNQYRGCIIEHHTAKIYEIPNISIKSENGLLKVVDK
jgi:hypothetical protein|nr:MAG TPA: protein of unknown function (DUF4406) [Caudoviricetes sp.]